MLAASVVDTPRIPSLSPPREPTNFVVFVFTDIVNSTGLKEEHGPFDYKVAAELHNQLLESLTHDEGLTIIDNAGDGYFAQANSIAAAVRFALRLQHGMRTMPWPKFPLQVRVGIHAGEAATITANGQRKPVGRAVDLTARIASLAMSGQILLSTLPFTDGRDFIREHPPVAYGPPPRLVWREHGSYRIAEFERPLEIFEVGAEGLAPFTRPPASTKAYYIQPQYIYVSYSQDDEPEVSRWIAKIRERSPHVFAGVRPILAGDDTDSNLEDILPAINRMLVMWTRHARKSERVRKEWELALQNKKELTPVLLSFIPLPPALKGLKTADLRNWSRVFGLLAVMLFIALISIGEYLNWWKPLSGIPLILGLGLLGNASREDRKMKRGAEIILRKIEL
jgi:class 3 adenylate cyclase